MRLTWVACAILADRVRCVGCCGDVGRESGHFVEVIGVGAAIESNKNVSETNTNKHQTKNKQCDVSTDSSTQQKLQNRCFPTAYELDNCNAVKTRCSHTVSRYSLKSGSYDLKSSTMLSVFPYRYS